MQAAVDIQTKLAEDDPVVLNAALAFSQHGLDFSIGSSASMKKRKSQSPSGRNWLRTTPPYSMQFWHTLFRNIIGLIAM